MLMADNAISPPEEWRHDSQLRDKLGNTVAMLLAQNGKVPQQNGVTIWS